ncbi:hypothetical protein [Janthinobacterium sp. HLS12-2]|uniref:hypothetical protein n=1 Tax=Janthinobacterium sp. HLS12-2 TaxID=1259324 RepID=UPI003F51B13E
MNSTSWQRQQQMARSSWRWRETGRAGGNMRVNCWRLLPVADDKKVQQHRLMNFIA